MDSNSPRKTVAGVAPDAAPQFPNRAPSVATATNRRPYPERTYSADGSQSRRRENCEPRLAREDSRQIILSLFYLNFLKFLTIPGKILKT